MSSTAHVVANSLRLLFHRRGCVRNTFTSECTTRIQCCKCLQLQSVFTGPLDPEQTVYWRKWTL